MGESITKGTRNTRKLEYFKAYNTLQTKESVSHIPKYMFHQHRDWTDHIACLRTIMSYCVPEVPDEDAVIKQIGMQPGMYYSADIYGWKYLDKFPLETKYGCLNTKVSFDDMLQLLKDDWFVMMQTMINYSHWLVLCGYYCIDGDDIERNKVLYYDPYYDTVQLACADEFIEMWVDGAFVKSHVKNDFVAVRALHNE